MSAAADRGPAIVRALGLGALDGAGGLALTLDEGADLASRQRMLTRATRAEVLDALTEAMRARLPIPPSDAILAEAADAIVARLAALRADLEGTP